MRKIFVLGMGPGHADYLLPLTKQLIFESDVLIGDQRHLAAYTDSGKVCYQLNSNLSSVTEIIQQERKHAQVAVLLSGDPGFYGMLNFLQHHFSAEEMQVVPGISAFQYLMAKIGEPWYGAALASLHGRDFDLWPQVLKHRYTILLTDRLHSAHYVASQLKNKIKRIEGEKALISPDISFELVVGSRLSYPDERIVRGAPDVILKQAEFPLATMVIINEKF